MNVTQQGILALIKSALTAQPVALPEQFDIELAYPLLRSHSLQAIGYAGALRCGISKEKPAMQQLRRDYYVAVVKSERQMAAIKELTRAFDAAGIDYMLLKGSRLKKLYPEHEFRCMGDADVLIRMEQYPKIRPLMRELGYVEEMETDHELIWSGNWLHVELHKRLVSTRNADYCKYYGNGWGKAIVEIGNSYAMRTEDEYIFVFVHFVKHYRAGGVGLRQIVDLWVYLQHYTQMDMNYIRTEMKKMDLLEFYEYTMQVIHGWFADKEIDARTEYITQVIFESGNWGTTKNHLLSEVIQQRNRKQKSKWFFSKVFLPVGLMKRQYPVLRKLPILLPVCWVCRWFRILLRKREKLKWGVNMLTNDSSTDMQLREQALEYVGLRLR